MKPFQQYPLLTSILLMIVVIISSFFWKNIPSRPMISGKEIVPDFRFVYVPDSLFSLEKILKDTDQAVFVTSPARGINRSKPILSMAYYPIFDGSTTIEQFKEWYPYLPPEGVSGLGNSVYFVDYAQMRMFYLNADAFDTTSEAQLAWLSKNASNHRQPFELVFLSTEPRQSAIWREINQLGVHVVIVKERIYVSNEAQNAWLEKKDLLPTDYEGWSVFQPKINESNLFYIIEGNQDGLAVKTRNRSDTAEDWLHVSLVDLPRNDLPENETLIAMSSTWKYARGQDVLAIAPGNGYDRTGEKPITQPFQLPITDWRNRKYDDSNWREGQAPFGHTKDPALENWISQWLAMEGGSSYVFRKTFQIDHHPDWIQQLKLHIAYEDGFILYLNGEEVTSNYIHSGLTDYRTMAVPNQFQGYESFDLSNHKNLLREGENLMAVQLHRSHPKAPNLFFDLSFTYRKEVP